MSTSTAAARGAALTPVRTPVPKRQSDILLDLKSSQRRQTLAIRNVYQINRCQQADADTFYICALCGHQNKFVSTSRILYLRSLRPHGGTGVDVGGVVY